jgi:hypothetical protein
MRHMAEAKDDFYFQLAARFLFEPDLIATHDVNDPSTMAATTWFSTRDSLPAVLQQWRRDGARRVRDSTGRRPRLEIPAPRAPRDDDALRRRRVAEAARRDARRKKT